MLFVLDKGVQDGRLFCVSWPRYILIEEMIIMKNKYRERTLDQITEQDVGSYPLWICGICTVCCRW